MKIKRNVNGQEMEFELTFTEVFDAHKEYEFDCTMEDVKNQCEDYDLSDKDITRLTKKVLHYLYKNDCYYEAYWDSVNCAVDDFMKNETK